MCIRDRSYDVPAGTTANGSLSFLGVVFSEKQLIGRVRIVCGNSPLGVDDDPAGGVEIVAMDDFIYGEPIEVIVQ